MSQICLNQDLKLPKYDQYFQPTPIAENISKNVVKKPSIHKGRNSQFMNISSMSKPDFIQRSSEIMQSNQNKIVENGNPILQKNLLRRHYGSQQKLQSVKLQRISPKNVTIKFEKEFSGFKLKKNKNPMNRIKPLAPFRFYQMNDNKFYMEMVNQKAKTQTDKQNTMTSNQIINSLFNVKSIKMIKRLTQTQPCLQRDLNEKMEYYFENQKTNYSKMFKQQKQLLSELQKNNPRSNTSKHIYNMRVCLSDLKKIAEYEANPKYFTPLPSTDLKSKAVKQKNKERKTLLHNSSTVELKGDQFQQILSVKRSNSRDYACVQQSIVRNQDKQFFTGKKINFVFEDKLIKYKNMLIRTGQTHGINVLFPQSYSRNQLNFYVGKGNNSVLVKEVLKKRWWLGHCQDKKNLNKNNVVFTQLKDKTFYNDDLSKSTDLSNQKQMAKNLIIHNHFEQNEFLGNKKALFYNMRAYYQSQGEKVFDYLPVTLHITSPNDSSYLEFAQLFAKQKSLKPSCKTVWILKPGQNSNRGNGITVHQTYQSIQAIIKQANSTHTYILQKYIEKPFLYNKRKFDIRCYMLLVRLGDGNIKGYWYKEGYIRTSGYQFSLEDCGNSFVHLTNDAIQVHCDNYGKYEDGNKLSYDTFQKYLDTNYPDQKYDFNSQIIPKLKKVSLDSIKATYARLGKWKAGAPTFELFGLDFMIDEEFNPWLIEINTNPCLQTSSRVLQKIIPSLLDNVFKLSVDLIFPPPNNWSNCNKHLISKNIDRNLFELVFDESQLKRSTYMNQKVDLINQLPMDKIGQIDEDNQIYDEDQDKSINQ